MNDVPREHSLGLRVYLEDTDAGGIVYHASYVRFMERARTEWLRAAGLDQTRTFAEDLSFVVHSMRMRFLQVARLDETLTVTCEIRNIRAASMQIAQRVIRDATGEECCNAEFTIACISLATGRARRLPARLREAG
jgi:tol-pal system-associated acyl-CoA thioesterase